MPPAFHLKVLGSPELIAASGSPVDLPLGKPLAALCFVALESSRVTRDDLAGVLWSRSPADRARASVRQALWLLRKALGEDPILEDEGGLRVETDRIAVDLDALELHLAEGRLVDAWRMWEGGPLQGFSIPDAARWNAWAERLRGGWERRFGEALEVRAAAEDGAARVTWLRRALEVRPYRESAHAALVETFIHQHRPDEAEEALHRARTVVDDATPGLFAELEERLRAIRKEAFQDSDDALRFEFVGRAAEFATLAALWRSVRSGRPRNAAVTGPAGIGKTRLTDELLELTRAEGAVVAGVKGVDTERSIELGAVATLVREMLHLPGAAGVSAGSLQVLHGLVPSSAAARAVRLERPGVAALADAFLDLVEAVAHEAPLVLRVEDLHWVDSRSRSLFFRTARQLRDARVLFLCTCRTEEADGSALRVVEELGGRGRMELVELGPLSRVEVAEMLGLMFRFDDPAVADACADRLGEASGGNPLFLLELLRGLRDEGFVEQDVDEDGTPVRSLRLPAELGLPGTVREALERRLADLSEDARHLARTVARAREPASPAELTRGHPGGESAGVAALGELIRRDVVRWTHDERLILAHDSMRARLVVRGGGRRGPTLLGGEGRRPALVVLAAVALAVLVFALARGWEEGTAGEPVGLDGIVFFDERPHLVGYRPAVADEGRLVLDSVVAFSPPPGRAFAGPPFRSRDGWIVPARGNPDPSLAPDAWLLGEGVDPRLVLETPGDDVVRQVLPDGGHLLLQVEDPDTSIFRMNAVRMPLDGGPADTTVLHVDVSGPAVSVDGRYVLAVLPRVRDSVVVLHPDGTRRDAVAVPHGRSAGLAWCPPGYEVLGLSERDAAAPMLWSWRPGAGAAPVEVDYGVGSVLRMACSPGGEAILLLVHREGLPRLVMVDRESGEVRAEGSPPSPRVLWWTPDQPSAAPSGVALARDSLTLRRGGSARLRAEALGNVEDLAEGRLTFASRDPLIASVQSEGRVTGNGPGSTWVVAALDRWLTDSVRVHVLEGAGGATLFSDPLAAPDPESWWFVGHPTPAAATVEGQPVVSMRSDGSRTDGMLARETFRVDRGATVEVDFHLELTRVDQQAFTLCLLSGAPPDEPELVGDFGAWSNEGRFCFSWPVGEFEDRDPEKARFGPAFPAMGPVPVGDVLRPGEWNRVSIQVRPDGVVSLFVNEEFVADHLVPIQRDPDLWRMALFGRAADTDLFVRNAVVWDGTLHPVPGAGPD